MSTMPPYAEPQFSPEAMAAPPSRTSALAVTSLVLSVVACCPVVGLLGPLLGVIAAIMILASPHLKGLVFAILGIVIGVALQAVVLFGLFNLYQQMVENPKEFVTAVEAGDWTAARAASAGPAAAAGDEEYEAFAAEYARVVGTVDSWSQPSVPPDAQAQPGQTDLPWMYSVRTTDGRDVEIRFVIRTVDETTGAFRWRPTTVSIVGPDGETIEFPPGSGGAAGAATGSGPADPADPAGAGGDAADPADPADGDDDGSGGAGEAPEPSPGDGAAP